jgi:hypothetical protein
MGSFTDSKGRELARILSKAQSRGLFRQHTDGDVEAADGRSLSELSANVTLITSELYATNTAVRSYVDSSIAALVDSAPATLDTLNELAAALGDDANFASTLTTNLSQKLGSTASVTLTGDATASGSFSANAVSLSVTLADSGVTAGSYGNTTVIPVFDVDSKGRITGISTAAAAGLASMSFDASTDTLTVGGSDGSSFTADFSSFTDERKADLANTNAYIASVEAALDTQTAAQQAADDDVNARVDDVEADLATQTAKQASDLANTNAYIASEIADRQTDTAALWAGITGTNTAVRSYVDAEVAALVDSAPEALDTLNELAAALGDDANFATTLTTNLGQKLGATASVTLTGEVTGTANFSSNAVSVTTVVAPSGVTAGTYGSSTLVPVVTVGSDGRVTSVTTQNVGGITGASYEASNNTITISASDGSEYTATITDLKEISDAAAELANTNTRVAVVESNVAQKLGATASIELTGDATATGSFSANAASLAVTLSDSGVSAGSYGSSTEIPVVTVDAKGRVTGVSTTTVAGVSDFSYNTENNTFTIETADGGSFTAQITDLEEVSDALGKLANTNAFIAQTQENLDTVDAALAAANTRINTLISDLDTQEAKQASDLANTNARIAVTEGNITSLDADVESNLANTNAWITSVAADLDTQEAKQASDLANTNAYIASSVADVDTLRSELYSTNTAIRSYVDSEVANLVDSAPEALDTLNELAAALGDDASFAASVNTNLSQKLGSTASVTLDGDVTGTASFSANAMTLTTDIADSGVTAGSYGSSTAIPVVTVGSDGRVTSVTTSTVAGVTGLTYADANNTMTISTADGSTFSATIEDFELASDAAATLANTNAYIASVQADVDANEATERAALANTNAYIASVETALDTQAAAQQADDDAVNARIDDVETDLATQTAKEASDLANTNAYIASVSASLDTQTAKQASDLANTNAYIASSVADVTTLRSELYSTNTAIRSYVDTEVAALVDAAPEALDTLNELAAALGDDANFATTLSTNLGQKLGATATVTLTGDVSGTGTFSSNAVTISVTDQNLGNTNAYIASVAADLDTQEAKQASDLANTNSWISGVETDLSTQTAKQASDLANTNAYIARVDSDLTTQISTELAHLANTNAQIITLDSKVDSNLANTNAKMLNIESNLLATNTAIRALIPDEIAFTEYAFTATAGQTAFTGTDDNGQTFSYDTDKISVFLNGIMLVKGVDYVQTNSSTITLDDAAEVNDVLTVQAYQVANYVSKSGDVAAVEGSATGANSVVDTFGTGDYRSAEYMLTATDSTDGHYEAMKVLVIHNGSETFISEFGNVRTGGESLMDVDADIFGGNVRLLVTPTDDNVGIKAVRTAVSV